MKLLLLPTRDGRAPDRSDGFSLIELAAIVFTLALLASVLFPAFGAAGDSARRAVCFNNLKQLGAAAAMYPAENRDYMALPNWGNDGFKGWLYTATNNASPDPGPGGAYESNPAAAYAAGLWFPYVRDPKVYLCPVDIQSQTYTATNLSRRAERLSSYIMNGAVCGYSSTPNSMRITSVWSTACYLVWGPDENLLSFGNPGAFAFNDGSVFPNTNEGLIEQLHTLTGGQILTVGGGVQFVSVQRFKKESAGSGKTLTWWYQP